ncbi:MAG: heterodisulfide reductase subunit C [Gracilibacter sp. BRH_c7a]|nr:MAG: heterodisulfide reductase subunit C [Gracilibacter sp. BRH_c7a]
MGNISLTGIRESNKEKLQEVIKESGGVKAEDCYQCGKCSAGCPVVFGMDNTPRQIMRFLQLSMVDEALKSNTIWMCAGCQTCSVRCPKEVDIARVMESLRILAREKGYITEKSINLFHELFLKSVEATGRVYEMGLILGANIIGMKPLKDAEFGLPMITRGKLALMPHKIKDNGEVKKIFENARKRGAKV